MGALIKFFLFIFISIWVIRTFSRQIMGFFVKSFAKKMANEFEKQNKAYERNYTGPFKESVYQDSNIHVISDKTQTQRKQAPKAVDFAEDVDFEEVE